LARTLTSRRTFLTRLLAAGVVSVAGFSVWEAHDAVVEHITISLRRLPAEFDGFTIAQLSDIHFDEYLHESYFRRIVERVNALRPDMIALTGDFVTGPLLDRNRLRAAQQHAPSCARVMSALRAPDGVFAVLGNHDHYCSPQIVTAAFRSNNIPVLVNEARPLQRGNRRIWICGVDSVFGRTYRPRIALAAAPADECRVVLLHEPDCADDVAPLGADFMMAGHSHGGQIRIPLLGAPVLPSKGRKYPIGLRTVKGMQLYTNRGIGVIHVPMRFACPPEITLYTLKRG
jgi:predicted MPP superfamily phosphohydrolase